MLPETYSRADAVANVQATALLVSAFALGRADLLAQAMQDRLHQPYRAAACPLLGRLLPMSGSAGVLGVALSGAGPSVLLLAEPEMTLARLRELAPDASGEEDFVLLEIVIAGGTVLQVLQVTDS